MGVGLETVQVTPDFGVGPIGSADKFPPDDSIAIDQVAFRPHLCVKETGSSFTRIADGDQIDVAIADETGVLIGILIDADRQNSEIGIVVVELDQGRKLLDAGSAPGRPEVQQDDSASIVG